MHLINSINCFIFHHNGVFFFASFLIKPTNHLAHAAAGVAFPYQGDRVSVLYGMLDAVVRYIGKDGSVQTCNDIM